MATFNQDVGNNEDIKDKVKEQAGLGDNPAALPEGTTYEATDIEVKDDEILKARDKLADVSVTTSEASSDNLEISKPTAPAVPTITTTTTAGGVDTATAATGKLAQKQ